MVWTWKRRRHTCKQAAHTVRALESVWTCQEVLSPISCQFRLPDSCATGFLVFGPKPAAHELLPAVTKRIWLGIAILFLLMYISPGQFKNSSEVIFSRFLANEDLSCNLLTLGFRDQLAFMETRARAGEEVAAKAGQVSS